MNDRFKFRVWDKEIKKFRYSNVALDCNGKPFVITDNPENLIEYLENVEINLSTDQIDRKGNLIYFDDIVVDYYGDAFRVCKCIDDMNYGKVELCAISHVNTKNSRYISFCEKVGDAYTKPELLEG